MSRVSTRTCVYITFSNLSSCLITNLDHVFAFMKHQREFKNFKMSSPPPPPAPPRSQRPLHNSEVLPDHKRSTKNQSTNTLTRGYTLTQSSSSSRQQCVSANATASGQSTLKRSYILDWLHGKLSGPSSGPSVESYAKPDPNTTDSGPKM